MANGLEPSLEGSFVQRLGHLLQQLGPSSAEAAMIPQQSYREPEDIPQLSSRGPWQDVLEWVQQRIGGGPQGWVPMMANPLAMPLATGLAGSNLSNRFIDSLFGGMRSSHIQRLDRISQKAFDLAAEALKQITGKTGSIPVLSNESLQDIVYHAQGLLERSPQMGLTENDILTRLMDQSIAWNRVPLRGFEPPGLGVP